MFGRKWFGVLSFAGCLLLFLAIFLSSSIYSKINDLNGQVSMNKVTISLKENSRLNGGCFSTEDIDDMKRSLNTGVITYSAQETSTISHGTNVLKARVVGADELAPIFGNISLVRGGFFSQADCMEKSRVAVIDYDTAWKLFNNDDVVGCYVDIFGSQFKIIGVVEGDRSVIGKLTIGGNVNAYIPVQTLMVISNDSVISYIQCKTDPKGITGKSSDMIEAVLFSMGKNPENYILKDYNVKGAIIGQKPDLLIFFMGLFITFVLLFYTIKALKKTIHDVWIECKTDYLLHVALHYRPEIFKSLVLLILTGSASIIIWRIVRFSVYIPPDMIPGDLTDTSYYLDLFFEKVSGVFTADAYTVPFQEVSSNVVETIFNQIFYFGCLLGLLLFYTGLTGLTGMTRPAELKGHSELTRPTWYHKQELMPEKLFLVFGVFLVADLIIFALLAHLAGLSAVIELKVIIIYWSFVFANIVLFVLKEEKTIKAVCEQPDSIKPNLYGMILKH